MSKDKVELRGIGSVFSAILLWGFLPLYWRQLGSIPADVILANRIIWSFVFVIIILGYQRRIRELFPQIKSGKNNVLFIAGVIISFNWFTYIYAVNSGHIVEASLGYYINPLLTIFLARVVEKEKMDLYQLAAVILAFIGVAIITFNYGQIPWIALVLAITFSSYSLIKKRVQTDVVLGISLETIAVVPIALTYLLFLSLNEPQIYTALNPKEFVFLLSTGVITAVPLMLFAYGAQRIPLMTVGFINYLSPTINLFLGVFIFKEPFTIIHILTFGFIWTALVLYSLSQMRAVTQENVSSTLN
jgi:chloramphenicol-sensitive protein RarD